jgi:hypothetical protein
MASVASMKRSKEGVALHGGRRVQPGELFQPSVSDSLSNCRKLEQVRSGEKGGPFDSGQLETQLARVGAHAGARHEPEGPRRAFAGREPAVDFAGSGCPGKNWRSCDAERPMVLLSG